MTIFQFIFMFAFFKMTYQNSFNQFISEMETKVIWLSSNMSEIFKSRCQSQIINCDSKSVNLCDGTAERECLSQFPTPDVCASEGIKFSTQSGIRLPISANLTNLTIRQRQFICSSTKLTPTFSIINDENKNRHSYAYFGSSTGAFRVMPSFMEEQVDGRCYDYDPRRRPWFVAAISGGKNIILILDISGSMDGHRINNAKGAVKAIISTISVHDFVGFIVFNDEARVLGGFSQIQRGSNDTKNKLIEAVDQLTVSGRTNYEAAFEQAFNLLSDSIADEYGSPCGQTVFIFMTDGSPTSGFTTSEQISHFIDYNLDEINQNGKSMKLTLMSYAFGVQANTNILNELSCRYNGILFIIEENQNIINKLSNYYLYLAEGANILSPTWSEPYIDAFGLGEILTLSMPVYFIDQNNIRTILGVAGIDVLMSQLLGYEFNRTEVLQKLIKQQLCFQSNLDECKLEAIRLKQNGDSTCNNSCYNISSESIESCNLQISKSVWKQPSDTEEDIDKCCGLTKQEQTMALIISFSLLGALIVVAIIIGLIFCRGGGDSENNVEKKSENINLKRAESSKNFQNDDNQSIDNSEEEIYYKKAQQAGIKLYQYEPFE